jgi:hypothetical protein
LELKARQAPKLPDRKPQRRLALDWPEGRLEPPRQASMQELSPS